RASHVPCSSPSFPTRRSSDLLDSFLAFGIAALVAYVKKRREKDEDYVILRVASIGFVIWGLCTGMSAFVGMMLWAAGRSSLSLGDRKSTRLNSSHVSISYAVF